VVSPEHHGGFCPFKSASEPRVGARDLSPRSFVCARYDAVAAVPQDILVLHGIYYVGPLPISEEHECLVIDATEDLIGFPVDLAQPGSD
jgi:hypothetical protein